jgi:hypothetical protein
MTHAKRLHTAMTTEPQLPPLSSNSRNILDRQKRAEALRAKGLKIREVAIELQCSIHVAGNLLARSRDQRVATDNARGLNGLPHQTVRALLAGGFRTREEVASARANGCLHDGLPGIGPRTIAVIEAWLATTNGQE